MQPIPLRESLSFAMREACKNRDLSSLRSISGRVAGQMRAAGFTVAAPSIGKFADAFLFIRRQMQSFDRLPRSDRRRRATVDMEVRQESASTSQFRKS